jgi:serine/threonine protein kinase
MAPTARAPGAGAVGLLALTARGAQVLVDPATQRAKLCDFGCSKRLQVRLLPSFLSEHHPAVCSVTAAIEHAFSEHACIHNEHAPTEHAPPPRQPGMPSVSYVCSRFYRAPELILGASHYTTVLLPAAPVCPRPRCPSATLLFFAACSSTHVSPPPRERASDLTPAFLRTCWGTCT